MVAEIIEGELVTSPRPASRHAFASSVVLSDLMGQFHGPGAPGRLGGWWILYEPELHLGADVIVPDLAGWRHERMPVVPDVAAFEQAPDWICEVLSASTAQIDRGRKMRIYAREEVGHLWLVDPLARTLEVYRREGERWVVTGTHGGVARVRVEPFDAIELDLARWWLEA